VAGRWRGRLLVLGLRQPLFMHCPIISGKAARHSAASQKEAEARNFSPARFKRGPFSRQRNAPRRGTMRSGENFPIYALDLSRVDDPAIEDALLVAGFFLVIAADPALESVHATGLSGRWSARRSLAT
jgi:hypothetical protein